MSTDELRVYPAEEDVTSPTPDPEPSQQPLTLCIELKAEPTAGEEPKPAAMVEPDVSTEPAIASEPNPHSQSDQVSELAIPVGVLVEFVGIEEHPDHFPPLRVSCSKY